ncbi:3-oxoacyl-[acyl-carrier protein] reductase [Cladophialophora psammophila CBS 110553]|uniref:3-oxoacyl-[acyl-carrier protein] reductase n=1 Tax=Cladophialophora psammophila CBS 110553 TaxID=1182543 RepID=W9WWN2_9EURO|nr:3-oxoacyl-[acyl-carrier protein] reductase [Cladophialophora psammophila CBS 110553]EXJ72622.1 3-oxoacyl-[acyl-carrier protein] reductase [Cladophialophora psammophila CBS 110553]
MAPVRRPLEDKLAIVTGASRGIGAAIARHLGAKGCNVLGVYTSNSSTQPANELVKELIDTHKVKATMVQVDLSQPEHAAPKIVDVARATFALPNGDLLVDILINNAGVGGDYRLEDVPVSEFHRMYAVNVLAPLMVTQAVLPYLPHDRSGRIVNISSVASSLGFVTHTLYGGTKAALEAMTRTWARELSERATVNAVNPGPVEGDMYLAAGEKLWKQLEPFQLNCPLSAIRDGVDDPALVKLSREKMGARRPGYWTEIAGVVGMLCGQEAGWCTGSVVCANGGFKFTY